MGGLHPNVQRFKAFVKENPYVLREVKSSDKTLQDLYEEWVLFGEDDPIWQSYREGGASENQQEAPQEEAQSSTAKADTDSSNIINMIKSMNFNDLQQQLAQFNGALTSIQDLLGTFRQGSGSSSSSPPTSSSPFSYRED
ncbi:YlbD family protein [Alteribacter populi]|uniref:YlbD family protein n=1 Tax=Alteribacter populi TaxID=2011011 RepID=UPI0012FDEFD5|nr:YlbD family protein [Alteribacter populi]